MAAPIRFLSGRQQQQKIGIEGSTDNQKVLEVIGQVGIGTTSFEPSGQLEVRGDVSVSGVLTTGSLNVTGSSSVPATLTVESLSATGVSTFGGAVDVNAGLDVDGQSDLDEVVVAGVATFSNAVDINSTLDVDGDTQLDDLNVAGVSTFSSAVNATAAVNATDIIKGYKYTAVPYGSTVTLAVTVASKDATHRYNGTGSGNGYVIDGIQAPFLTLTPGRTYRFTNDNTGSHPLKFYLEADKTTLYETNVDFQNTYTEITVTDETPIVLHYQCTNHGFMGNAIQTNANVVNTNYPATIRSTLDVSGVSTFTQLDVSTGGLDVDGLTNLDEVVVAGVSTFTGNIVAVSAEFSGNVTIAGTLTAEDKTNIDSLGIVTARTGVRVDAGGLIVTAGVSTFTDSVDINNGVGVVGGLTADSLTISGVTTGINAAGISSFVRIDVDGQADLDEVVIAGVATFQGAVNFDVNSEINIGTGVTILGNNLHVTGIVSALKFIGDGSGITNLPGINTIGSSNLTDVNVSGTTTTTQLRISGIGTAEKFFVSTGGFEVDGQSDLDELVVAGVSTFSANTFINADLSVSGDIGASGIITATGINLVAGSGLDVGAVGVLTALSVDVSTGGIDVDGQATLDEVVVAGVATFSALADVNNRLDVAGGANIDQLNVAGIASFTQLDVSTGGIDVDGQATLDEVVVSGASTFTGAVKIDGALDIGVAGVDVEGLTNLDELIVAGVSTFTGAVDINAGLDVDGQATLDEVVVAGVSTFSAKAVFNTAYPSIDADNEIQVGTAIQLGKAGVVTATTFVGNVTGNVTGDVTGTASNASGATGDFSIADKIVHTGDTNTALRFPAADTFTVETGGAEALRVNSSQNVNFLGSLVNVNATGVSSFVQLDVSTGGLDVDGQTDLDELQVAGVSTFSAKAVFNTAYPSIDADNEIQVGTAIQLGKAGVITATSFSGSGANLTGIAATDHVSTFDLVVAGVSTFVGVVTTLSDTFLGGQLNILDSDDGGKLYLGASNDLQIYHTNSGTSNIIHKNSNNSLFIKGITIDFRTSVLNHHMLDMTQNGPVNLYYANSKKLETTSTGVVVTGDIGATGIITATGMVLVAGSGLDVGAVGVLTALSLDISTGGIDVDGQSNLDEVAIAGVSTFSNDITFTGASYNAVWDKSDNALEFAENAAAKFGEDADLEIYHATHSYIKNKTGSTAEIRIGAETIRIGNVSSTETYLKGEENGAVELYHDNSKKFETTSGGATVTGTLTATTFSGSGASLTNVDAATLDGVDSTSFLRSDAADIKTSGNLTFNNNIRANFGTNNDLEIYHSSANATIRNNTGSLYLRTYADNERVHIQSDDSSGGITDYFLADGNSGEASLHFYGAKKLATNTGGIDVTGGVNATGVVTATSFSGDGSALTGIGGTENVSTKGLVVAGVSTFIGNARYETLSGSGCIVFNSSSGSGGILEDSANHTLSSDTLTTVNIVAQGNITVADKLIHRSDDNTTIRFPANDTIAAETAGVERLRINSVGDIQIAGIVTATGLALVAGSGLDAGATGIVTAVGAEFNGTSHIKLPAGSTGQRPGSPTAGDLRYNSDDGAFEGYTDSWGAIGGGIAEVDTNVSSTSAVGVGSFATASFRSAEVVAQISQVNVGAGVADYQVGKYLMIHDGTTVTVIEQAAVSTGDSMIGSFDGAINGSNAELRVTMVSSGIATVTTKISTVTV